jgi:tRNA (mo5U34)-methyltransferase
MSGPQASAAMDRDQIARRVSELGEWFQNMELGGVWTAPRHFLGDYPAAKWQQFRDAIPADLTGKTVLDIGCNAGFYSLEMKRRGAARVLGIDFDPAYLAQARFAAEVNRLDIEFREMGVYDIANLSERFDVVLFLGVLYHLRHPLLALDLIYEHAARDILVFQSMLRGSDKISRIERDYPFSEVEIFDDPGFPAMYFIERRYSNDPTNWWIPNRACAEAMLRSAGFEITAHPEHEVYICRRRPDRD